MAIRLRYLELIYSTYTVATLELGKIWGNMPAIKQTNKECNGVLDGVPVISAPGILCAQDESEERI